MKVFWSLKSLGTSIPFRRLPWRVMELPNLFLSSMWIDNNSSFLLQSMERPNQDLIFNPQGSVNFKSNFFVILLKKYKKKGGPEKKRNYWGKVKKKTKKPFPSKNK